MGECALWVSVRYGVSVHYGVCALWVSVHYGVSVEVSRQLCESVFSFYLYMGGRTGTQDIRLAQTSFTC